MSLSASGFEADDAEADPDEDNGTKNDQVNDEIKDKEDH